MSCFTVNKIKGVVKKGSSSIKPSPSPKRKPQAKPAKIEIVYDQDEEVNLKEELEIKDKSGRIVIKEEKAISQPSNVNTTTTVTEAATTARISFRIITMSQKRDVV